MTILVPTDFSDLSKVAVRYAIRLAGKLKANIILLTVVNANATSQMILKSKRLEEELIEIAKQDAAQLIDEVKQENKDGMEISFQYLVGFPVESVIEHFVVDNKIDMIVMGTKGATGLKKVLMGSNAVAVIDNSSVPVIAVPGESEFSQINKIVYATDMDNLQDEIKTIAMFADLFGASVEVVHVLPTDSAKEIDIAGIQDELVKVTKYPKISFHVSKNNHIGEEVDAFVAREKADMVTMFTHKLDFYEKLFGKSVTRQLAFHGHVPLLTFNKTTIA